MMDSFHPILSYHLQEMIEVYYQLVYLDGVMISVDIVEVKDAANIIHLR